MPRPTARVLLMLEILQSGGVHRVAELAERLDVDERTVRRYVSHLLAIDIPVESLRGSHGGYRLAPGFRMPPLMLTEDEALAAVLALSLAPTAGPAQAGTARATDSVLAKLRLAMPSALARRIDALLESTTFTTTAATARVASELPETATLLSFAEAARAENPVAFRYEDRGGRRSQRVLMPFGIVAHSGRWYVTGSDSLSNETRTFRLDRVAFPRVLPEVFSVPADFDAASVVRAAAAATPWRHKVAVLVEGDIDEVSSAIPNGIATVEPATRPGWVSVRFRAENLDWVPGMLLRLERPFLVEAPAELRALLSTIAERLRAASTDAMNPDSD